MPEGTIERAELVAAVDTLVDEQLKTSASIKTVIEGCMVLVETDSEIAKRLDIVGDRIDIVNKRIRRLEQAVERLQPR